MNIFHIESSKPFSSTRNQFVTFLLLLFELHLDSGLPYESQGHKMQAALSGQKGCHGLRRLLRRPGKLGTRTQHLSVSCPRFS